MVDKSNDYGYVPSSPTQAYGSNNGIFESNDVVDLINESQWSRPGQLELIETKDLTGTTPTTIDFTNLKEDIYNVHLLTYNNLQITSGADTIRARVSNDGGSTFESTSQYDGGLQTMTVSGTFSDVSRTNFDAFDRIGQNAVSQPYNGYIYIYNAGDSSKFTFLTQHSTNQNDGFRFGNHVYHVAETVNAFRLFLTSYTFKDVGSVLSLYGIRFS
tara:strand:+ start:165 stop:809 length:645 start_codon:yes stop_codon:yes gene_type:complete